MQDNLNKALQEKIDELTSTVLKLTEERDAARSVLQRTEKSHFTEVNQLLIEKNKLEQENGELKQRIKQLETALEKYEGKHQ